MRVLSRPRSEPVFGTMCRRLTEDYEYRSIRHGVKFTIPKGFVWDGTSIPRVVRRMSFVGGVWSPKYEIAGLLHDFLYREGVFDELNREIPDIIFKDVLRLEANGWYRANSLYYGVRAGGWASYNKKQIDWAPNGVKRPVLKPYRRSDEDPDECIAVYLSE